MKLNLKQHPPPPTAILHISFKQGKDFDKINIIHVAGSKGKGSVSAICESIMRQCQYKSAVHTTTNNNNNSNFTSTNPASTSRSFKTGLYTSPHLLEVRERIRINGRPLAKDLFARYFFEVWDKLEAYGNEPPPISKTASLKTEFLKMNSLEKSSTGIMQTTSSSAATATTTYTQLGPVAPKPSYFRYLTLMSFHVFIQEQVDFAIIEVGIGGAFDSTNIIEQPLATGITSLGMDHMSVLGNTLAEIAWQKAGIFKNSCPAFSSLQKPEATEVIKSRANELGVSRLEFIGNSQVERLADIRIGMVFNGWMWGWMGDGIATFLRLIIGFLFFI